MSYDIKIKLTQTSEHHTIESKESWGHLKKMTCYRYRNNGIMVRRSDACLIFVMEFLYLGKLSSNWQGLDFFLCCWNCWPKWWNYRKRNNQIVRIFQHSHYHPGTWNCNLSESLGTQTDQNTFAINHNIKSCHDKLRDFDISCRHKQWTIHNCNY